MDEKDARILSILRKNARTPNVELAKAVGLTEGAVRRRIENLIAGGTITRFTIETSGGAYFGIVMLKALGETKSMMGAVHRLGLGKEAYEISGEYDGCLVLEGGSIEDIDSQIDRIRKLPEVADTRTYLSFKKW